MKILTLLLISAIIAGCSSVLNGDRQSVMVVTPEAQDSKCSLTDSKGRVWYVESTPGTVLVKKGGGPISVICKKDGYQIGVGEISESMEMNNMANILFPPGFIIDSLTGSSKKYDSGISIEMEAIGKKNSLNKKPWE
jgi:hypothetical protein